MFVSQTDWRGIKPGAAGVFEHVPDPVTLS